MDENYGTISTNGKNRVNKETKRKRGKQGKDELSLKEKRDSDKKIARKQRRSNVLNDVTMETDIVPNDDLVDDVVVDDDDDDDDEAGIDMMNVDEPGVDMMIV